jgi:hypothetical protein
MRYLLIVLFLSGCATSQTWKDAGTPCERSDTDCQAAHDNAVTYLAQCKALWWPLPCPTSK